MAIVRIEATSGKTIPTMAVNAAGEIWDGVSAFKAVGEFADADALATAVNKAAMTFASVEVDGTHLYYSLTLPAGVAAVACSIYAYDGTFTVGDSSRWSGYNPTAGLAESSTVDGVPILVSLAAIMAALLNKAERTETGVDFKNRAGTDTLVEVTIGTDRGDRTASTINEEVVG